MWPLDLERACAELFISTERYAMRIGDIQPNSTTAIEWAAQALLSEGLRRAECMGATVAFVSGSSPAANALYRTVIGDNYKLYAPWVRQWSC